MGSEQLGDRCRALVASGVAIIGDQHAADIVLAQRGQMILGKAARAIGGGDVAVSRAPERHRVDQRLGQDHLATAGRDALHIPHAAMRAGQIEVQRGASAQVVPDLAAIDLGDDAARADHGHHQAAGEVFVPAFPVNADALQASPDVGTGLAVLLRQAQPQRAVGDAKPEPRQQLRVSEAARLEVFQALRAVLERLVVIIDHLAQQRRVVRIEGDRGSELAHRRTHRGR